MKIKHLINTKLLKLMLCLIFASAASTSSAADHEKIFALSGGFNTKNTSGVSGVHFIYGLNSWLRISPSASYIFRNHGMDAFSLNADCQFVFKLSSLPVAVYPLAGIGYWSWNNSATSSTSIIADDMPDEDNDDVSSRSTRYSINMGGGMQWNITPTLALTLEGKYALMRHTPTAIFSLSIGYSF